MAGHRLGAALGDAAPDGGAKPKVGLFLEGKDLPNLDRRHPAKSDPFCIVERRNEATKEYVRLASTETVYNNLNPQWAQRVDLEYEFGAAQVLRFSVYDRDEKGDDLRKQVYIGSATCTIAQIVLAESQRYTLRLSNPRAQAGMRCGQLVVRAEELRVDLGEMVTLQFACMSLRNAKKPFYVLCRETRDGVLAPVKYSEVHRSYHGTKDAVNTFKAFSISLIQLCNGDKERRLCIQFFDYDRKGNHYLCGSYSFTLADMEKDFKASSAKHRAAMYKLKKWRSRGTSVDAGRLAVMACSTTSTVSFLDYIIKGDVIINTVFAIDMSSTNGNPADPASLHYDNPSGSNEYEAAIRDVGRVLAEYDSTQAFPGWGFSACLPPKFEEISQCFPLSDCPNAICTQIDGVVASYRRKLKEVAPHLPCRLSPVLKKVIGQVKEEDKRSGHGVYTVLVLVTDGAFDDFGDVADAIVAAAELPLSIVIVGIGSAEKPLLEALDGDEKRLCDSVGIPASRDIVQYVPFQKHRGDSAKLAEEVLSEIPDQLVSYFRSQGMRPGDKREPQPAVSLSPLLAAGASDGDDVSGTSDEMLSNFTLSGPADFAAIERKNSNPNLLRESSISSGASSRTNIAGTAARHPGLSASESTRTGFANPIYPSLRAGIVPAPSPHASTEPPAPIYGSAEYGSPAPVPVSQAFYLQPSTSGWTPELPNLRPPGSSIMPQAYLQASPSSAASYPDSVYAGPTMRPPESSVRLDAPEYVATPPLPPSPPLDDGYPRPPSLCAASVSSQAQHAAPQPFPQSSYPPPPPQYGNHPPQTFPGQLRQSPLSYPSTYAYPLPSHGAICGQAALPSAVGPPVEYLPQPHGYAYPPSHPLHLQHQPYLVGQSSGVSGAYAAAASGDRHGRPLPQHHCEPPMLYQTPPGAAPYLSVGYQYAGYPPPPGPPPPGPSPPGSSPPGPPMEGALQGQQHGR
jgi:Copine/C2 domain